MSKEIIWKPSKDLVENSKLTKFLNFSKIQDYNELEKKRYPALIITVQSIQQLVVALFKMKFKFVQWSTVF